MNTLGGVLTESMTNMEMDNCGIYYNGNFGFKITEQVGADNPKVIRISKTEFDTNDGIQIDIEDGSGVTIDEPYLLANVVMGVAFTKGIVVRSGVSSVRIQASQPRLDPSLTGLTVHEFESGCIARS